MELSVPKKKPCNQVYVYKVELKPFSKAVHFPPACVIDGGAASGALPHSRFGRGPICSTSRPPFAISGWLNHGLFQGFPFKVAD